MNCNNIISIPTFFISFTTDNQEDDVQSELTFNKYSFEVAAGSNSSNVPNETYHERPSDTKEHEVMWLKLHIIRQQEKITELDSTLSQCQSENEALKAEMKKVSNKKQLLVRGFSTNGDEDNQALDTSWHGNELLHHQFKLSLSERTTQSLPLPLSSLGVEARTSRTPSRGEDNYALHITNSSQQSSQINGIIKSLNLISDQKDFRLSTSGDDWIDECKQESEVTTSNINSIANAGKKDACIDDSNGASLLIKKRKSKNIVSASTAPPPPSSAPKATNGMLVDFGESRRRRSSASKRSLSLTEGTAALRTSLGELLVDFGESRRSRSTAKRWHSFQL